MKKLLFILLLLCNGYFANAQSELKVFEEWISDAGSQNFFHRSRTKTDASGNVYVAGATVNSGGTYDILVAKYNSAGVQQWIQQYNGYNNYHDFATAIHIDGSGNVYLTGTVTDSLLVQGSDIITMKYNSSGTLQWASRYNGSGNGHDAGADIIVDNSNGDVYVTGSEYNSSPNTDAVTIRYNSSGVKQWSTVYNHTTNLNDIGAKIKFGKAGTVAVAGAVQLTSNTYAYGSTAYNISNGTVSGAIVIGTGTCNISYFGDMVLDNLKNIYITGATYDSIGGTGYNYYLMKLDSTLAMQWERNYNGASNLEDIANGVAVDPWGNVYITGHSTSSTQGKNIVTRKYNSSGTAIWTQTYNDTLNGDDMAMSMAMDPAGNIYITGYDSTHLGNSNYITIKYDTAGSQKWLIHYDGMAHLKDKATNVCIDNAGAVVVTGLSEVTPNNYEYITIKYVEKNIITPTDAMGEEPASNFLYYENKGQLISTDSTLIPDVRFYTNNTYPNYYFKNDTMSMVFSRIDTIPATDDTLHRIDMAFVAAKNNLKIYPLNEQKAYLNYFLAHCPDGVTGVNGQKQLVIPELYEKIDLMYTSNQNGLKYYFIVKPGGSPKDIYLRFYGATSTSLDTTVQELTVTSALETVLFDQPFIYQIDSNNDTINGSSRLIDWKAQVSNGYSFKGYTGYDVSKVLIIEVDMGNLSVPDITDIEWSTFYGGNGDDSFNDVKTDISGNLYIAGTTTNNAFPLVASVSVIQNSFLGITDAVVLKFNPDGIRAWVTYFGGTNFEDGKGIATDASGNVYLIGNTMSSDLPPYSGTANNGGTGYYFNIAGATDGFIAKLTYDGYNVPWRTCYGGTNNDWFEGIQIDGSGNIFIGGRTESTNFPGQASGSAYSQSCVVGGVGNDSDGVLLKFNSSGARQWATCLGGSQPFDYVEDLVLDPSGNLFVTGGTQSSNFPWYDPSGTSDYFDNTLSGGSDAFVAKFSNLGEKSWITAFGGSGTELGKAIATTADGGILVAGNTGSNDMITTSYGGAYYQSTKGSSGTLTDVFLLKFNSSLGKNWSTYYGDTLNEYAYDLHIGNNNVLYLSGSTESNAMPFPNPNPSNTYNQSFGGSQDAFVTAFNYSYDDIWGTYLGGSLKDYGTRVISDINSNLFLIGKTNSRQTSTVPFPLDDGASIPYYQGVFGGGNGLNNDGTITRFDLTPIVAVGISENETLHYDEEMLVYPNPSSSMINIRYTGVMSDKMIISIYNVLGEIVKQANIVNQQGDLFYTFDIADLATGIYSIQVSCEKKSMSTKFIKQ